MKNNRLMMVLFALGALMLAPDKAWAPPYHDYYEDGGPGDTWGTNNPIGPVPDWGEGQEVHEEHQSEQIFAWAPAGTFVYGPPSIWDRAMPGNTDKTRERAKKYARGEVSSLTSSSFTSQENAVILHQWSQMKGFSPEAFATGPSLLRSLTLITGMTVDRAFWTSLTNRCRTGGKSTVKERDLLRGGMNKDARLAVGCFLNLTTHELKDGRALLANAQRNLMQRITPNSDMMAMLGGVLYDMPEGMRRDWLNEMAGTTNIYDSKRSWISARFGDAISLHKGYRNRAYFG